MRRTSRRITFGIGVVIGAIFLWLAVRDVELAAVTTSLRRANMWLVFPFILSLVLFYWLKAVRWAYLLQPTRVIAPRHLVPAMMLGFAGNNVLPVRLGELVRIYVLGMQQDLAKSTVLGTVTLERVFDVVTVLLLITVAMYGTTSVSPELAAARTFILVAAIVSASAAYGIATAPRWLITVLAPLIDLLPATIRTSVRKKLADLRQGFAVLTESPGHALLHITMNSMMQWALLAFCVHLAIIAFDVRVGISTAVMILGLLVAGISLPSAPGFIGTIEYCFVLGLGFFGVGPDIALSIGIYYHTITFLSVTMAGAVCMKRLNTSIGNLAEGASKIRNDGK